MPKNQLIQKFQRKIPYRGNWKKNIGTSFANKGSKVSFQRKIPYRGNWKKIFFFTVLAHLFLGFREKSHIEGIESSGGCSSSSGGGGVFQRKIPYRGNWKVWTPKTNNHVLNLFQRKIPYRGNWKPWGAYDADVGVRVGFREKSHIEGIERTSHDPRTLGPSNLRGFREKSHIEGIERQLLQVVQRLLRDVSEKNPI